jgi:hypothetical protein
MSTSKTTIDLKKIQDWAEERGGKPSKVKGIDGKEGGGILRINFPGYSGEEKLWRKFPGTNGIRFLRRKILPFFIRTKPVTAKKAGFLN